MLRERCELVARRNASHPSPPPSAQKVRRGTCPRTLEKGQESIILLLSLPPKNGNQNGIKMTAREPKDLRELLILTSQTPESSNIIPPDNKRIPAPAYPGYMAPPPPARGRYACIYILDLENARAIRTPGTPRIGATYAYLSTVVY